MSHLAFLSQLWSLSDLNLITHAGVNVVYSARQNQMPVILKIIPDQRAFTAQLHALEYFQQYGAVKLLAKDIGEHALLLEKIPGVSLKTFFPHQETLAVQIASQVMQRLHAASREKHSIDVAAFKTLKELVGALNTVDKHVPHTLLQTAKAFSKSLLQTPYSVLLHGDLHHENILMADNGEWLAIDPKGIIGDPAYDVATFMCNPMPELLAQMNVVEILQHRLDLFAKLLHMDQQRLYQWSYVRAVLGACWCVEDGQDPTYFIRVAGVLGEL